MAAQQARNRQPEAAPGAVAIDRLEGIFRAGRKVPAIMADEGLEAVAIDEDRQLQAGGSRLPPRIGEFRHP
jgi:hypothetical protein